MESNSRARKPSEQRTGMAWPPQVSVINESTWCGWYTKWTNTDSPDRDGVKPCKGFRTWRTHKFGVVDNLTKLRTSISYSGSTPPVTHTIINYRTRIEFEIPSKGAVSAGGWMRASLERSGFGPGNKCRYSTSDQLGFIRSLALCN